MPLNTPALESVGPGQWSLAGTLTMPADFVPAGGSLELTRRSDLLSPAIRKAMTDGSLLPAVQITTPGGDVRLVNARIVDIAPTGLSNKPGKPKTRYGEYTVISFTYQQIVITRRNSKKSWTDDWSAGG